MIHIHTHIGRRLLRGLLLSSLLLLAAACHKDTTSYYGHCVETYYSVNSIEFESETVEIGYIPYYKLTAVAQIGEYITEQQSEQFERLSEKNGDTDGGHYVAKIPSAIFPASNIRSITVKTVDDWDRSHRKGGSLDDICHFVAYSIYPFILNDYQDVTCEMTGSSFLRAASAGLGLAHAVPVDKPLTKVTADDTVLIGGGTQRRLFVLFIPVPASADDKRINISVTDESKNVFSATFSL